MTREKAIKRLREILAEAEAAGFEMLVYSITEEDKEILKMAIEALEQEPCADCISRETLLKYLGTITKDTNPDHYRNKYKWYHDNGFNLCKVRIEKFVENLALATPQPKVGEWITNSNFPDILICSCCNTKFTMWVWEQKNMHYCPNCGCRIKGEGE